MATERADYKFTVKEGFGDSWIMLEPMRGNLSILEKGFLGLELRDETNHELAQEIAQYLNERIKAVSYTDLSDA